MNKRKKEITKTKSLLLILSLATTISILSIYNANVEAKAEPTTDENYIEKLLSFPTSEMVKSSGETPCMEFGVPEGCTITRESVLRESIKELKGLQSSYELAEISKRYLITQMESLLSTMEK